MKSNTLSDIVGTRMAFPEYYKCKYCKKKIHHTNRGQHLLTHVDKLYPDVYKPVRK